MERKNDILIPPTTRWLADPNAQLVCRAIAAGGHQVLFVGGCVRNALFGLPDSDVDLSTDAHPDQVTALAEQAGLKVVPTGIDHGTVTIVAGGKPFEVTTFRRDVATDGRRAVVAFSNDITDDARRRDFTMNALYAAPDGQLIDPLGGLPDLIARRVRFIEDAEMRIREDYLRILRFFRFAAWYGNLDEGFDADAMSAIATNLDGLETLSGERVGQEMRKLLAAPDPAPAIAAMRSTGVLHSVLPGADDRWIAPIVHFETLLDLSPDWICRLAALGGSEVPYRLRLSKAESRNFDLLRDIAYGPMPLSEIAYRHGKSIAQSTVLLRSALAETPPDAADLDSITTANNARFPVTAADLMPEYEGPALGQRLAYLEQLWIDSMFELKKDALLNHG
ncbi:MAG: CCA tRNA nucleotidyltransferase [Sulfitobacter sp.]